MKRGSSLRWIVAVLLGLPGVLGAQQPVSYDTLQLRPGDVISALVWREPDLSGQFIVDPTGSVVIPMLGQRQVAGRSWNEVREELLTDYARELRNPSIELTPLRRVFVMGEVNNPGMYTLDPAISLAGAVAMAGGASPQGELRKIRVLRDGTAVLDGVAVETRLAQVGVRSGDQILVGRRGWFERNSTFLVSALLSITSIVVTLGIR